MTPNHSYFEFLCALAVSGEVTGHELVELREHSLRCVYCRDRILEMRKVDLFLLSSHAFTRRRERVPQGMRERFIARAIEEGLPLKAPSAIGFGTLGLASTLFIVLLATATALKGGPSSRPALQAGHFDAARLSKSFRETKPMSPDSAASLLSIKQGQSRNPRSSSVAVRLRRTPSADPHMDGTEMVTGDVFQNRYFPAGLSLPRYTLATPDVGRLLSWPHTSSRFPLAISPALIREGALQLLADSEHSTSDPAAFPSQFTFTQPAAEGLRPPIFKFSGTPLKFHFAETVTQ